MIRADFDPEVRAWYLTLSDAPRSTTVHVSASSSLTSPPVGRWSCRVPATAAELAEEVRTSFFQRFPGVRAALPEVGALAVA